MVLITKNEKDKICEMVPAANIHRTVRQKSKRHRYYLEETKDAMNALRKIRGEKPQNTKKPGKPYHRGRRS